MFITKSEKDSAILVSVVRNDSSVDIVNEYLDELSDLCTTAGILPRDRLVQKLEYPNVATYLGKGKIDELIDLITKTESNTVVFDDDLTPTQVRNLEKKLSCKILDRSLLILDIFAIHARTAQAKLQIELAQYQYMLPRLTRMWTHLTKQKGGSPGMRGPGEKELETDKRIVNNKISLLKDKLQTLDKQALTQSKQRQKLVRVSLVGYTNVGKSTLMNLLSKSDVISENKLFATTSSTIRKVVFNDIPFLLSDTVGFIRKLPHTLIECFKSTLQEVKEADILLHVIDFSHKSKENQIQIVNKTLNEIGVKGVPIIMVFNKIDKLDSPNFFNSVEEIKNIKKDYSVKYNSSVEFISALHGTSINDLKKIIYKKVKNKHMEIYPNYVNNL